MIIILVCRFWYHMYGKHMGTLSVVIQLADGGNYTLWSLSSEQGDKWLQAQVPLPPFTKTSKNYRVRDVMNIHTARHTYSVTASNYYYSYISLMFDCFLKHI